MLRIRLTRTGKKHEPHYRVVVTERRSKRDGKTVDQIGHWHPTEDKLVLDKKAYESWVGKGAQATEVVRKLVISSKLTS
ncbi:MAG: 30S ribosomal protein S16 [bacterium]|nr:30S ribosomal protein S16 [bacterium]